jgi:hypothetical protein
LIRFPMPWLRRWRWVMRAWEVSANSAWMTGIYEMYWLSADSAERRPGEAWCAYAERSCAEVTQRFQERVREVDFRKEALAWTAVRQSIEQGSDPLSRLVFVGYFVTEAEWLRDQSARNNV